MYPASAQRCCGRSESGSGRASTVRSLSRTAQRITETSPLRKTAKISHHYTFLRRALFKIHFSEVFHSGGGFDIVIQNPPYVQIKGIEPSDRRIYEKQYEFATGRFNLFYLFIERCSVLLKSGGIAAFIIPDRLLLNTQCKEIRRWLLNANEICGLVSFEDQVFETAVVDSILLFFQKKTRENLSIKARRKVSQADVRKSQELLIPIEYFELSPPW